jgi:hypothetical protein
LPERIVGIKSDCGECGHGKTFAAVGDNIQVYLAGPARLNFVSITLDSDNTGPQVDAIHF